MKCLVRVTIPLCGLVLGGFLSLNGTVARADGDDYFRDRRWREHERREHEWRERRERAREERERRERWDHRYWDRDYYRPPAVVYDPEPPPGVNFMFRLGR